MIDKKDIIQELNSDTGGGIFLIETTAAKALEVHLAAAKWISDKNYVQVILSTSRPCTNLLSLYKKNNIDTSKIVILCTSSLEEGKYAQKNDGLIHISSSSSLTEIAIALSQCMERIKDKKFILVDSINTLLIHNKPNILAMFVHSILTNMRINTVPGLLISLESETNKEFMAEISQLCDKIIKA